MSHTLLFEWYNVYTVLLKSYREFPSEIHLCVKRFDLDDLPTDTPMLDRWVKGAFKKKEALLRSFYEGGSVSISSPSRSNADVGTGSVGNDAAGGRAPRLAESPRRDSGLVGMNSVSSDGSEFAPTDSDSDTSSLQMVGCAEQVPPSSSSSPSSSSTLAVESSRSPLPYPSIMGSPTKSRDRSEEWPPLLRNIFSTGRTVT